MKTGYIIEGRRTLRVKKPASMLCQRI